MGAIVSCIEAIFRTIGNCLMAIVNAIGAILTGIVNAVVGLIDIIISCLTCGHSGGRRSRTRHTMGTSRV